MATLASPPELGQLVQIRSRQWVVNEVRPSSLPAPAMKPTFAAPQHLLTLSSVEDDGLGEEVQVVWEIEPGAKIVEKVALPEPTGFDPPDRLDAFLDAVRWGAASTADVKNIQSPFRSGIEIEDYQLDPVVRAIQMPRVNLLIADDVGLGKTIEAGMVALELIIRHRARKILVVCPSALQIQWRDQMRDKFGLDFRIVDSELMRELRRKRGIHANPWAHFPRLITSIDFLKRERPLRLFRETLPAPGEPIYPRKYDLMVVDEAHNYAPSGRGKYATDSLRTQALRELVLHFEHKLFLTATPHNGYRESFSALLELLDNQRFSRGTEPDRKQLEAIMVRRLKTDPTFAKKWDGSPRFPPRVLKPIEVAYPDEEREIHAALKRYTKLRSERASDNTEKFATEFVLKTLKKRLFSCPAAFVSTLEQHEKSLETARRKSAAKPSINVLQREFDRVDEEYADDTEYDDATADALDSATRLFAEPTDEERALLKQMKQWAMRARGQRDAKAKTLVEWLKKNIKPGGKWFHERVIIFTEYRATQNWLKEVLATEGFSGGDRLLTMYGGMDSQQREAVKAAFQTAPEISPVRILLATDAASEGLDFQNFCSQLIHYEIPWNPNRMEQRNGRVDRHGQKADQVTIHHFVGQGYNDRANRNFDGPVSDMEADLEFLMRVAQKIETIREDLGKVGPVIAEQVEEAMLGITRISRQTVKNILKEHGIDPGPKRGKGSWDEFLKIHADTLWQCDFVTKRMWTMRGFVDLYMLVFLHLGTRRCWISPATVNPDSAWVSQQAKNFLMDAEDLELAPEWVMRDNDTKFTAEFDEVFKSSGATIKRNTPLSPNLRAHVERFIQTLKVECLDKFVIVADRHLNHVCREWALHYNRERPHSSRGHLPPGWDKSPAVAETIRRKDVVCTTRLGGLLKHYERRAA